MIKKIIRAQLMLFAVLFVFVSAQMPTFASDVKMEYQNTVIYVDDLGIYASTGKTGLFTSADGLSWAKRKNICSDTNLTSIAWGGTEDDRKALISVSGNNDSLVLTNDFNDGIKATAVILEQDSWSSLVCNTKIVWDDYSKKFYFGALRYLNGTLVEMGLYSSAGEVRDDGLDYGMSEDYYILCEKVELGDADVYKNYLDTKETFTDIEVDNQGRLALVVGRRLKASGSDAGTALIGHYTDRYIIFHSLISGKTAGVKTTLQGIEISFDDTGCLFCGSQVSTSATRQVVATYNFDDVIGKLEGQSGLVSNNGSRINEGDTKGSKDSNTNVIQNKYMSCAPKGFGLLKNKDNEKFMVIIPGKGETEIASNKHNDLGFFQYNDNGEVLKKYYTFVNDDATLSELLGNNTDTPKKVMDVAVKPDRSEMVVLTENDTFVIKAEDVVPAITNPTHQDALRGKLIEKGTGAVTSNLSHIVFFANEPVEMSSGDSYTLNVKLYDTNFAETDKNCQFEILNNQEEVEEFFDISELENGKLKAKDSFLCTEEFQLRLKVTTDTPSVVAMKNISFKLMSDTSVSNTFTKTTEFSSGDVLSGNISITNNSDDTFEGYAIVFLKQGYKYIDFIVEKVSLNQGKSKNIVISKSLDYSDCTGLYADALIIDKAKLTDVQ